MYRFKAACDTFNIEDIQDTTCIAQAYINKAMEELIPDNDIDILLTYILSQIPPASRLGLDAIPIDSLDTKNPLRYPACIPTYKCDSSLNYMYGNLSSYNPYSEWRHKFINYIDEALTCIGLIFKINSYDTSFENSWSFTFTVSWKKYT